MPPINYPDPPIAPLPEAFNPNSGSNGTAQVGSACQYQNFTGKVTLTGGTYSCDVTPVVGSDCQYQKYKNVTGKVTLVDGKYYCADFTLLAAGSACQYQSSSGTVTVIDGTSYCNIGAPGVSSTDTIVQRTAEPVVSSATGASSPPVVHSTDTIVQRTAEPVVSSTTEAVVDNAQLQRQLQVSADRAKESIQASPTEKQALLKAVRSNNMEEVKEILLNNGFTDKQLEGASFSFQDTTGGKGNVESIKWTITIRCCPPEIIITIEL
jgi:hypothetical protein